MPKPGAHLAPLNPLDPSMQRTLTAHLDCRHRLRCLALPLFLRPQYQGYSCLHPVITRQSFGLSQIVPSIDIEEGMRLGGSVDAHGLQHVECPPDAAITAGSDAVMQDIHALVGPQGTQALHLTRSDRYCRLAGSLLCRPQ